MDVTTPLYFYSTMSPIHTTFLVTNLIMFLSTLGIFRNLFLNLMWKSLLYIGCILMGIGYFIYSLERFIYTWFDPYSYVFFLLHQMIRFLPSLPNYGGGLYYSSDTFVFNGRKGIWQYNPRLSRPPNCTSGRHACSRRKHLYWRHHTNTGLGIWSNVTQPTPAPVPSDLTPTAPPWWWQPRGYF